MDVHVPGPITRALLLRGVDVLPAQADDAAELPDPELLQRATDLNRVLYTNDRDFLSIGPQWQKAGRTFSGILFAEQLAMTFGQAIEELTIIGLAGQPEDCANRIQFLPL
jgi:hypothetical protein